MRPPVRSWPHRLLVAAAHRDVSPRLLGQGSPEEWSHLPAVATAHGVEGWIARELRGRPEVPAGFQIQLQAAAARVAANHQSRLRDATAALEVLGAASVGAMLLKGPALVERYYGDASLRTYGDVDVFVHAASFERATKAFDSAGLSLLDRNWPLLLADLRGQVHYQAPSGGTIELHWHIVNGSRLRRAFGMDVDELWDVAVSDPFRGMPCLRLPPADEIAHLCLHAAMHGCNRLVWLTDLAMIAASERVDWDRTAIRLQRWGFGSGGYLVLSLAAALAGAPIPLGELKSLRPGALTMREYRRLLARWDLSEPERDSRVRELFIATAGDGPLKRTRLVYDIVVPPRARDRRGAATPLRTVRRVTVGTAARVAGKLGEHGEDHTGIEYDRVGDQEAGRSRYVAAVSSLVRPVAATPRVIVLSPSRSVGMSHYARALAEDMASYADVVVVDGAAGGDFFSLRRRLSAAGRDGNSVVLVTSPHWIVPLLLRTAPRRGGFVFHDPILDAATPATRRLHLLYYRILARRLGVVILHDDRFARNVLELELPARSVVVVPHGFVPKELEVDRPYDPSGPLLFIGRFHPYKGFGVFADAVRILADRGIEVPILAAGRGLPRDRLPALPWVELREGELSDAEFRDAIAGCSAVVLPYERANQSGVLATAFRAGRPAIATTVGAFPSYVRDGVNGLLVAPSDAVALAAVMERFRADPAAAIRMAEGARRTWDDALSPRRAAERIVEALVGPREPRAG